jgi:hypothetical protein
MNFIMYQNFSGTIWLSNLSAFWDQVLRSLGGHNIKYLAETALFIKIHKPNHSQPYFLKTSFCRFEGWPEFKITQITL